MTEFQRIVPVYISRFKEIYEELENKWMGDGKPGFKRQKWLREKIPSAFSKDNIGTLSRDEAIEIFSNFSTIGPHKAEQDRSLAATIADRDVINKVNELLHGSSKFSERYALFLDNEKGTKDVGEGITSEILCYFDPQEYGIISAPSTKALKIMGLGNFTYPKTGKRAGKYAEEYFADLKNILEEFRKDPRFKDADLIDLDYFLYFISQSQIWQIAGGKNGQAWQKGTWQEHEIAGYGTTGIEEKYGESICAADEKKLAQMYADVVKDKSQGYEKKVAVLLNRFINKVNIGDVFVVNKGTASVLGYGIVTSGTQFSKNKFEGDPQVYRKVIWVWDFLNHPLPVPEDIKNQFNEAISPMNFNQFQKIFPSKIVEVEEPVKMNENEIKIKELLEFKKQIILYGPPGTGKTFYADSYIKNQSSPIYEVIEKSLLDQRVFILMTYALNFQSVPVMKAGEEFEYPWKGTENWQRYFEEMQIGDIALTYHTAPLYKFTTVVRCTRKEKAGLTFEILHQFNGVTFQEMKSDPILKECSFVRSSMSLSLKRLDENELRRIVELSAGLTFDIMGIEVSKTTESVKKTKFVTFHPSFGYEDFIEGLRPYSEDGAVKYQIEEGVFKEFSRQAFNVLLQEAGIDKEWNSTEDIPELNSEEITKVKTACPKVPFYLIIDEINRGDISRIFGELITLIEADKRYGEKNELVTNLPYSKRKFSIPPNLYIIGTMNTADKSIALVDIALRRRFGFIEMMPDYDFLRSYISNENAQIQNVSTVAVNLLENINERISSNFDRDHQIGHSYFTRLKEVGTQEEAVKIFHFAWYREILPLLQEYYYDSPKKLHEIVGDRFVTLSTDKRRFQFKAVINGEEFLDAMKDLAKSPAASNT